jgi:cytochrome c-type biogenesis protein CcmF
MINTFLGSFGHLLVITAFISAFVVAYAYWNTVQSEQKGDAFQIQSWKRFARIAFVVHGVSILGVFFTLFYIIYNYHYEYHYAWSHSSRRLPVYYMISCFWEGQEGSFLLWMFWHVILGTILIATNRAWESSVMTIFALVQGFLVSMILGVVIFNLKLGSDPFILMRDAMPEVPIFQSNPNYIPEDGRGLNPLLQNYWMVIHPPTLFLGFALTLVPFAYCMAGLWLRQYREWVRPALPWALVGGAVLGLGILMGGYWAYETLNFGGYWNWDPVENAVYVPWLFLVAAIHTMIAFRKSSTALKSAMVLTVLTFILILYATFMTRSGILGNASVHSFTDLGLSGQLLVYLLAFTFLSIVLLGVRWREIPTSKRESTVYSREFWIFMGALVLCLSGFQVLFTTSIPVFKAIIEAFGAISTLALPADAVGHYTKFQIWGAVLIASLSGTGQFFWWQKMDKSALTKALTLPLSLSLLLSAIVIATTGLTNVSYMILLTASIYSIIANSFILFPLLRHQNFNLTGGAVAHIGVAMMLIGILFSSGYSTVISKNTSGLLYSKDFTTEMNENNVLLWLNKSEKMGDYQITYRGDFVEAKGFPHYVAKRSLSAGNSNFQAVATKDIKYQEKTYFKRGDTLEIHPENTYYQIEYREQNGKVFSLYPRAQVNPQMGLIASPDIVRGLGKDLYTHVSSIPDPTKEKEWSKTEEFTVSLRDTFFANDYVAIFEGREAISAQEVMKLTSSKEQGNQDDIGIRAKLKILGKDQIYYAEPIFLIKDKQVGLLPDVIDDLGVRISLMKIDPTNGKFTFGMNTTQKDYVIMKAMEKPLINVLWLGTLVVMLGFGVAIYRRYSEFKKMRDKEMEVAA